MNQNFGILSQLAAPPKGRKPPDRGFYTYGEPEAPRGNSAPGGLSVSVRGAVRPPNIASGGASGAPGMLQRVAGAGPRPGIAPQPARAAGGVLRAIGGVRGAGSGREDLIDAKLSDGEWVADAETVALLGDGSSEEGIRRLEEMRERLRSHKGKSLAKGKFSPDAKRPEDYMRRGK